MRTFVNFLAAFALAMTVMPANAQSSAAGQANSCAIPPGQDTLESIKEKYKAQQAELSAAINRESHRIKGEAPDVSITGHLETRRLDFALDLPEVTVRDQRIAFDVPSVTMRDQRFSYDSLRLTVRSDCRAGPDNLEFTAKTCHNDFPPFDYPCGEWRMVRGPDICLPTPVTEHVREEFVMSVPEFRMERVDWVVGVPEFTMTTQYYAFDYPVFIVDNAPSRPGPRQRADELKQRAEQAASSMSAAMKQEIRVAMAGPLLQAIACSRKEVQAQFRAAYDKLRAAELDLAVKLDEAKARNSAPAIAALTVAADELVAKKKQMLASYVEMRRELARKERELVRD